MSAEFITILTSETKINYKDAERIDNAIRKMCLAFSEEYEDDYDDLYAKFSYEKLGEFIKHPEQKKQIYQDIKNCVVSWDSSVYEKYRYREQKDTQTTASGIKAAKGELKCKNSKCRSDECYYYQDQTRSCDEGATTFVICSKCGSRYHF